MAAAVEVGLKSLGYASRTSMEVTAKQLGEAGFAAGQLLCVHAFLERTGKKMSCAAATAEIAAQKENGGARNAAFWLIWNGSSAVKVTWEGSASTGCNLEISAWKDEDGTTPIDVTGVWATFTATKTPTASSVTTATKNAVEVICVVPTTAAVLNAVPEGFSGSGNYLLHRTRKKAGETGTTPLELTASATGVVLTFAIRPAEPGGEEETDGWELVGDSGLEDGDTAVCALGVLDGQVYLFGSSFESAGALAGIRRWDGSGWDTLYAGSGEDFNRFPAYGASTYNGKLYVGDRRQGRLRRLDLKSDGSFEALTVVGFVGGEDVFPGPALWGRLYLGTFGNKFNAEAEKQPPGVYRYDGASIVEVLKLTAIGSGGEVTSMVPYQGKLWVTALNEAGDLWQLWTVAEDDTTTLADEGESPILTLARDGADLVAVTWEQSIEGSEAHSQILRWNGSEFVALSEPWAVTRGSDWLITADGGDLWASDYYQGITVWDGATLDNIGLGTSVEDPDESSPTSTQYGGAVCVREAGGYLWVVTDQPVKVWRRAITTEPANRSLAMIL